MTDIEEPDNPPLKELWRPGIVGTDGTGRADIDRLKLNPDPLIRLGSGVEGDRLPSCVQNIKFIQNQVIVHIFKRNKRKNELITLNPLASVDSFVCVTKLLLELDEDERRLVTTVAVAAVSLLDSLLKCELI